MHSDCAFEDGKPIHSIDFDYNAIDGYDFTADAEACMDAFRKVFDWIANVPAGDFKGIAIRVQTVRCILLKKDQVAMAEEIGVTKAAISQRMCDLRDCFKIRQPKAGLRTDETRQKFSEQCKQRHHQKKASSGFPNSQPTSTMSSGTATNLLSTPSAEALPLSKRLFALAAS
jgi:hypothetical protein